MADSDPGMCVRHGTYRCTYDIPGTATRAVHDESVVGPLVHDGEGAAEGGCGERLAPVQQQQPRGCGQQGLLHSTAAQLPIEQLLGLHGSTG